MWFILKDVKYQNSKGNFRIVGKKICIYTDKGKRYGCVQRKSSDWHTLSVFLLTGSKACGAKIGVFSFGCRHDEEKVGGHCFKKCSLLAGPTFPRRKSLYTCTRRGCNKNEFHSLGVCYEKCKEHYYHSVPWCFGDCSHFCGSSYEDYGLICKHKSIRKKFCKRPKYTQKSFKEYEAKTRKGKTRCSGYYVDGTGECPKIDVSLYLPRGIKC